MKKFILYAFTASVLAGCSKLPDPVEPPKQLDAKVKFSFQNVVGARPLVLKTENYVNDNGDTFFVNEYAYYISNISLVKENGTEYKEPESYHLVNERADSTKSFILSSMPEGNYTAIRFLIGVDSVRNVSGVQSGALAPERGMFWNWDTGYVMAKFEGVSPNRKVGIDQVGYHVGGFSGPDNVLRWVTLQLPSAANVKEGKTVEIHIKSDLAEWFKTPNKIVFNGSGVFTFAGPEVRAIADNYADMFTVTEVHN